MPPPSVSPPMPTGPASPKGTVSPYAPAAFTTSPAVSPVCARAIRLPASSSSLRMRARSSTMPPSLTPWPAPEWPPLRTASSRPPSRASETTKATSSSSTGRTITAGRRSIPGEKTARASS